MQKKVQAAFVTGGNAQEEMCTDCATLRLTKKCCACASCGVFVGALQLRLDQSNLACWPFFEVFLVFQS